MQNCTFKVSKYEKQQNIIQNSSKKSRICENASLWWQNTSIFQVRYLVTLYNWKFARHSKHALSQKSDISQWWNTLWRIIISWKKVETLLFFTLLQFLQCWTLLFRIEQWRSQEFLLGWRGAIFSNFLIKITHFYARFV